MFFNVNNNTPLSSDKMHANNFIKGLENLFVEKITVTDLLIESKIAWKVTLLTQSYVRRLHELSDSCSTCWSNQQYVSALTLARCLIETSALIISFEEKLSRAINTQDVKELDSTTMRYLFSTQLKELKGEGEEYKAIHVLDIIRKLDKKLKGLQLIYDNLSEILHPNAQGHFHHYSDLNRIDGSVKFQEPKSLDRKLNDLLCSFSTAELALLSIKEIQGKHIKTITKIQGDAKL